jgi:NNP family nitrate/nitrite transporter-like MFS transporter
VLSWALCVAVGAIVAAFSPPLPAAIAAFMSMAAAFGLGDGAVFALLGRQCHGLVGAAGGLGWFLPLMVIGRSPRRPASAPSG